MTFQTRQTKRAVAGLLVAWAVLEVACLCALLLLGITRHIRYAPIWTAELSEAHHAILTNLVEGRTEYIDHSPVLGWTLKSNGQYGIYRANSQRLRATREYDADPPLGVVRVAAFGDSFTHGDEVRNGETWAAALEAGHPGLEVVNFGVGGFGLDQAYLRYQHEGRRYHPAVVLIGFATENIYRHVNVYRPFYDTDTGRPLAKPRFVVEGDRLVLVENPMQDLARYRELLAEPDRLLPVLGARDYYYHSRVRRGRLDVMPSVRLAKVARQQIADSTGGIVKGGAYNPGSEAFVVTTRLVDAFVSAAEADGAVPVVMLLPNRADLARHRRHDVRMAAPLKDYLQARRYRYVDLLDAFAGAGGRTAIGDLVPNHYSPLGNRLVAERLWQYLETQRLAALRPARGAGNGR